MPQQLSWGINRTGEIHAFKKISVLSKNLEGDCRDLKKNIEEGEREEWGSICP